jgi:hypothetical protein
MLKSISSIKNSKRSCSMVAKKRTSSSRKTTAKRTTSRVANGRKSISAKSKSTLGKRKASLRPAVKTGRVSAAKPKRTSASKTKRISASKTRKSSAAKTSRISAAKRGTSRQQSGRRNDVIFWDDEFDVDTLTPQQGPNGRGRAQQARQTAGRREEAARWGYDADQFGNQSFSNRKGQNGRGKGLLQGRQAPAQQGFDEDEYTPRGAYFDVNEENQEIELDVPQRRNSKVNHRK